MMEAWKSLQKIGNEEIHCPKAGHPKTLHN
jgi:hypothetical protein